MTCPECNNPLFDGRDDVDHHQRCLICNYRTRDQTPEPRNQFYRERSGVDPDSPKRHQYPRTPEGVKQHRNALWCYRRKVRRAEMNIGETNPRLGGGR